MLYGPAHYCGVEVSANGPGLTSGNWWLPSSGEMIELMQDVTYGTSEYDTNGHLDPINEAIFHLNNDTFDPTNGFRFDLHSAGSRLTSSLNVRAACLTFDGPTGCTGSHGQIWTWHFSSIIKYAV